MATLGRIGVVGGGNMGSALIKGILAKGLVEPRELYLAEKIPDKAAALAQELGVRTAPWPMELEPVDLLILAVKPPDMPEATRGSRPALKPQTLVISVAAGVTLKAIAAELPQAQPLIRAMPNTPCLIGQGVTALAPGEHAGPEHMETALSVFRAVGEALTTQEKYLDAVTGLSGSGPAYVYLFIEALADAGVRQGLDRQTALTLAAHTVAGAARMVIEDGRHPAQLKDMVTSPGGTTIAGLHELERGGLRGLIMDAVAAATNRSRELGG